MARGLFASRGGLIGAAWLLAGVAVLSRPTVQYVQPFGGAATRGTDFAGATKSRSTQKALRTSLQAEEQKPIDHATIIGASYGGFNITPAILLGSAVGLSGLVCAMTVGTGNHHDAKGAIHGFRTQFQAKEKLSLFGEFLRDDTERIQNAKRERGSAFHEIAGNFSEKKAIAFHTGIATTATAAVAACLIMPNKDRMTSLVSREGTQDDLIPGSVYESKDAQGNWWPIKVNTKNSDGSYECIQVSRDDQFEGTTPAWKTVWPGNCRRVLRGDRVMPEHSNSIA